MAIVTSGPNHYGDPRYIRIKHVVRNSHGKIIRTYYTYKRKSTSSSSHSGSSHSGGSTSGGSHTGGSGSGTGSTGGSGSGTGSTGGSGSGSGTGTGSHGNPTPTPTGGNPTPHTPGQPTGRTPNFATGIPYNGHMGFNLENNLPLPQGSQTPWAQPTSISSMISGLLRESAMAMPNYMSTVATNRASYVDTSNEELAVANNMGGFGTGLVMENYGNPMYQMLHDPSNFAGEDQMVGDTGGEENQWLPDASPTWEVGHPLPGGGYYLGGSVNVPGLMTNRGYQNTSTFNPSVPVVGSDHRNDSNYVRVAHTQGGYLVYYTYKPKTTSGGGTTTPPPSSGGTGTTGGGTTPPPSTTPPSPAPTPPRAPVGSMPPMYNNNGPTVPEDINPTYGGPYNPWSSGEGGTFNAYGVSPQYLAGATMESMALANAYFAPQRMELAYQLGDMETDMRRLAVNLGRQVDDPVLQAKLYKDAAQAVRTMDVQQNTLAMQMADQRRKEEIQNFQFYDQLAQQEYQLRLANRQYYDRLNLDRNTYNLSWYQLANSPDMPAPASGTSGTNTGSTGSTGGTQQLVDSMYNTLTGYNTSNTRTGY